MEQPLSADGAKKSFFKRFWWVFVVLFVIVAGLMLTIFVRSNIQRKLLLEDRFVASFLPESGAAFKYNSPAIVDDQLYIGTSERLGIDGDPKENFDKIHDNFFYKMDLDLNVIWEYPLGKTMVAGAASLDSQKNIYFLTETFKLNQNKISTDGKDKDKIYLTTLKLVSLSNDGKSRWEKTIGKEDESWDHVSFSVSIDENDNLYFGHEKFYSYDRQGNIRWSYPEDGQVIRGYSSTPVIDSSGNIYYVSPEPIEESNDWGTENIFTYKFSNEGRLMWSTLIGNEPKPGEGAREENGPKIGGDDLQKSRVVTSIPAFGADEKDIYAITGCTISKLDTSTGELFWSLLPEGASGSFMASPAIDNNGDLYVGTKSNMESTLFAVSKEGKLLWKNQIGSDLYSSPMLGDDGKIYVGSETTENGHYHALDMQTGEIVWSIGKPIYDFSIGSAALHKGYAYIGTHYKGTIVADTLFKIKLDATSYQTKSPWPRILGGNSSNGRKSN